MKTEIQETVLYNQFKTALNIRHDMRPDDNPFVVACCKIAEDYANQKLNALSGIEDPQKWVEEMKAKVEISQMLDYLQNLNPETYDVKYTINFQFWGNGKNQIHIEKDGCSFYEDNQCETPQDAIRSAYEYFKRVLPEPPKLK